MAAYKCKMCGGDLVIEPGTSVCECEYCGTKQTVPNADNEKKMAQFARASKLLRDCEFDKASGLFEAIVSDFPDEAEAYWGLVLCRFGIEYVDDPATGRKVPTCHRSSFDSVMDDENLDKACDFADGAARKLYRAEAKAIEELRKGIIEVSGKEEPYDVFISYKETDENGERTVDSVIAQDIYRELTREGYRVFFSRISLENKLGTEYEPYIFAALNSAKVMLVVGTDYDHMNAVWVKNEWSRFLKLMASGQKKSLIPVFKDMDAYDMPKEFAKLTAQDMGKIGAMQDLVHGVSKLLGGKQEAPKAEPVVVQQVVGGASVSNLLDRMFLYLEDGKWQDANTYAEKVLDIDSRNGEAYLGKLMAALRICRRADIPNHATPIETNENYGKALRFGSPALADELKAANTHIITRNKNATYNRAQSMMASAKTEEEFKDAANEFKKIPDWKDAAAKAAECLVLAENARKDAIYDHAQSIMNSTTTAETFKKAAARFGEIPSWKDADAKAAECLVLAENARKDAIYSNAKYIMNAAKTESDFKKASAKFSEIPNWKDADEKAAECLNLAETARKNKLYDDACAVMAKNTVSDYRAAIEQFKTISDYMDSAAKIEECEKEIAAIEAKAEADRLAAEAEAKKTKKTTTIAAIIAAMLAIFAAVFVLVIQPKMQYDKAVELAEQGKTAEAVAVLVSARKNDEALTLYKELRSEYDGAIAAGDYHTVGLYADGTVIAVGDGSDGQCNVRGWSDIVAIAAGKDHTVGLRADGTVVAVGDNEKRQCNVSDWTDIIAVDCDWSHTVGLRSDGTVVAVGENIKRQCNVSDWTDIVAVACGDYHTVGLRSDGTVVAVGMNEFGQCNVSDWTDIVAIACGGANTVGLRSDGTVVAVGWNGSGECNVSDWTGIVAVVCGETHTVGLRSNGTVVAVGNNDEGQSNVDDWSDIVAVAAGNYHTVGLRADGTVVAVGSNTLKKCHVGHWTDIGIPNK